MDTMSALVQELDTYLKNEDWAALSAADSRVREVVSSATANAGSDQSEALQTSIQRLAEIYRLAAQQLDEARNQSGQEMSVARKNLKAAQTYLSNR